ncbi:hypothetical protein JOC54_003610 [Alkalihalobacillus xiaoxiensis]|uniref:Uncharacterized protein n=1 Tax=Shouchella xiaoxiensis TaxID=766895 RepID=A0ABS2SXW7_9BACI|nr:hypothetical protein [Shouchella xiaoxiensis]
MVKGETTLFRNVAPKEQTIVNLSGKADFYLTQLWRALFIKSHLRRQFGKTEGNFLVQGQGKHIVCLPCLFFQVSKREDKNDVKTNAVVYYI